MGWSAVAEVREHVFGGLEAGRLAVAEYLTTQSTEGFTHGFQAGGNLPNGLTDFRFRACDRTAFVRRDPSSFKVDQVERRRWRLRHEMNSFVAGRPFTSP